MSEPLVLVGGNPALCGTYSMALDEYLFESAERFGQFVWRLYEWEPPAVSIGRNQKVEAIMNLEALRRLGVMMVRRPTGGRAIYHSGDVCFTHSGITPGEIESVSAFRSDYLRAADMVVRFLGELGIRAQISDGHTGEKVVLGDLKSPCFRSSGRFEIVVEGKKIAGIAQYRSGARFLIQGSIRLAKIDSLNRDIFFAGNGFGDQGFDSFKAAVTSIEEQMVGSISWAQLVRAFLTAIGVDPERVVDPLALRFEIDLHEIENLERRKYANTTWNMRF